MNRRRIAIGVSSVSGLAVVAAGAMSLFGSGGSARAVDLHATPVAAVSGAVGPTGQAGTAQVDTVVTVVSPAYEKTPAGELTMHGSGLYDFGKQIGSIDVSVPPQATLSEVFTPSTLYTRSASDSAWRYTPTTKLSDGGLISGGATGPSLVFAMLGGVQPGVREVGQDVVRGVPVAHYQGTLDLAQAANAAKAGAEKQVLLNAAHTFTTPKVPFDAYLDGRGRLRRFVATVSFRPNPKTTQVDQATTAEEFYGFGTPVAIAVPKDAQPAFSTAGAVHPAAAQHHATTPSAHSTSPTRSHK